MRSRRGGREEGASGSNAAPLGDGNQDRDVDLDANRDRVVLRNDAAAVRR